MSSLFPSTPEGASSGAELYTGDGRSLALVSARLVGEASGGLARLVLEQRFENAYDENLRVTYRMPLPADGAISGYEFVIGERVIKGVIDRKKQARERFEQAIASGKTAALLEQERADIFTQQIGNIPARESVLARITIDQRLAWLPEGEWELRFPTVIGPRYIGSADTAADVRATHVKVTDQPLKAGIQIAIDVRDSITGGGKPTSPTHRVVSASRDESGPYRGAGDGGMVALHSAARLDRDIVLRWRVATPTVGGSLALARPATGNDSFGLLTLVPPAATANVASVPRDLIVLLDTSGSMGGGPLEKAKQVLGMMIDSLDEQDRFELIEFSNSPRRYRDEPVAATAKAKQAAIKWIRSREADGATEMRTAVIEAMTTLRVGAQRQIVVVTDGYVGGEQQILEALNRRLPKSCRLHVLGVGSSVNRSLATSLSRAGRGVEVLVGIDEDAERGAKRLLDRTKMPVLTNVEISGSALLRHAPDRIPDVFAGAPLVAAVAVRPDGGALVVRGQLAHETWEQTINVPAQDPGTGNQAIVALYARERVADVEANALFSSVDGEIEELGLTFQISTRMTSWVAIDESRRVTGPSRDQLIPQELPYGTSAGAFGLRGSRPAMAQMAMPPQYTTKAGTISGKGIDAFKTLLGAVASSPSYDADDDASESSTPPPAAAPSSYDYQAKKDISLGGFADADEEFEAEAPTGEREFGGEAPQETMPSSLDYEEDAAVTVRRRSTTMTGIAPRAMASTPAPGAMPEPLPQPKQEPSTPETEARAPSPTEAGPIAPRAMSVTPMAQQKSKPATRETEAGPSTPDTGAGPVMPSGFGAPLEKEAGSPYDAKLEALEPMPAQMRRKTKSRATVIAWFAALLALIALLLWWVLS